MRQREVRRTNMVTLQLRQLHVPPGQRLLIEKVTWADFEAIVEELGEHRGTRVAYSQGVLEIVSPLPAHEKPKSSSAISSRFSWTSWICRGSLWVRPPSAAQKWPLALSLMIVFTSSITPLWWGKNAWTCASIPHQIWLLKWISRHRPPCRLMPHCKSRKSGAITIEHYRSLYGMTVATSIHHTVPRFLRYP